MSYNEGDKIKLLVNHNGKPLPRPKYGYVVGVLNAEDNKDTGFYCEKAKAVTTGKVYLIQTSWSSGALWYTADAFKPAGGKNELANWRQQLKDYHDAQTMKHGTY
jgi:hypothetical protein